MSSEFASLIEANTRIDGSFPTPIPGLHLSRYSSRTQPGQGVQCPTLAIVAQGSKQLMLGDEVFTYAPGFCLVVPMLVWYFVNQFSRRMKKSIDTILSETIAAKYGTPSWAMCGNYKT